MCACTHSRSRLFSLQLESVFVVVVLMPVTMLVGRTCMWCVVWMMHKVRVVRGLMVPMMVPQKVVMAVMVMVAVMAVTAVKVVVMQLMRIIIIY